jgi:ABC-type branched-subunit amino acid transport system permease subunit
LAVAGLGTVIGATVGTVIFSWLGEESGEYIAKDYYIRRNGIND